MSSCWIRSNNCSCSGSAVIMYRCRQRGREKERERVNTGEEAVKVKPANTTSSTHTHTSSQQTQLEVTSQSGEAYLQLPEFSDISGVRRVRIPVQLPMPEVLGLASLSDEPAETASRQWRGEGGRETYFVGREPRMASIMARCSRLS